MALCLLVPLSPPLFEYDRLRALRLLFNCSVNSGILHLWAPDRRVIDGANHEDVGEADLRANLKRELLDTQALVVEHFGLLAADADDSEDFIWVSWQTDAFFWAVDIDDSVLTLYRLPLLLSNLSLSLLSLLIG